MQSFDPIQRFDVNTLLFISENEIHYRFVCRRSIGDLDDNMSRSVDRGRNGMDGIFHARSDKET